MEAAARARSQTKPLTKPVNRLHDKRKARKRKKSAIKIRAKMAQPKLPKCASEVSLNWKALSHVLSVQKDGNKRKKGEQQFFKSKKWKPNTCTLNEHHSNENVQQDIWFDDVDPEDLEQATDKKSHGLNTTESLAQNNSIPELNGDNSCSSDQSPRLTKYLAMDCEFVGTGRNGEEHMLARVSIVNSSGEVIYDTFVEAQERVVDYRTEVSGVRPTDLKNASKFSDVQNAVSAFIKGKILVGHSITTDLKVLFLDHPRKSIRDTAKYKPFQERLKTKRPSLKRLAKEILSLSIQTGEHSSVEDARAAMQLYRTHGREWEKAIKEKFHTRLKSGTKNQKKVT